MKRRKSKKIDKIHSPVDFQKRIEIWHDMEKGKPVHPNSPEPLEPSELSRVELIHLIEYLKYCEGLFDTEIADFLKMHRVTVSKRLAEIDEQQTLELEEKGFSTWDIAQKVIAHTDYVMRKARDKGDFKLYNDAFHKSIDRLQGLGIVFEQPQEVKVKFPIHSEEDEKRIISWLRKIELGLLPSGSEAKPEREIVELIPEQSND